MEISFQHQFIRRWAIPRSISGSKGYPKSSIHARLQINDPNLNILDFTCLIRFGISLALRWIYFDSNSPTDSWFLPRWDSLPQIRLGGELLSGFSAPAAHRSQQNQPAKSSNEPHHAPAKRPRHHGRRVPSKDTRSRRASRSGVRTISRVSDTTDRIAQSVCEVTDD